MPSSPAGSPPGYADWRALVGKSLGDRGFASLYSTTRDGVVIEPLYAARRDVAPIAGRGPVPWTIVQYVDDADPDRANAQALEDVRGGASGLAVRFEAVAGEPGLALSEAMLRSVLDGVAAHAIHLRIEPHPRALDSARWLRDLALECGVAPERADLDFGLNPLGVSSQIHESAGNLDPFVAAFRELQGTGFPRGLAILDARPFHAAGASEAQELAAVLAGAVDCLRGLDASGMAPGTAMPLFSAALAVDAEQFLSIAKVRALRLLWSRLAELCGAPPSHLPIHAETSRRMMTRADPHTNIVRATIAAFAAGVGGADSIAILPFTVALGGPDRHARAVARDLHHLLLAESHLARSADPAAGSGALEGMTDALAERAWAEFQVIEREGGMLESLRSGAFQARVAAARAAFKAQFARGEAQLVGVTVHAASVEQFGSGSRSSAMIGRGGMPPISLEDLAREVAS